MAALGPNKPRQVRANTVGIPAVGSTAYDNLKTPDIGGTFPFQVNAGCSSCRGNAGPKPPVTIPVDMVLRAALEVTTAPQVLAQRDAVTVKESVQATRQAGVATVPDAYLNAHMMVKVGKHAVDLRIVPFNPYHASARNMQRSELYAQWHRETTTLLAGSIEPEPDDATVGETVTPANVESSPIPTLAVEVAAFLDANPERVDEVEKIELALKKPRQTVLNKIVAVRKT